MCAWGRGRVDCVVNQPNTTFRMSLVQKNDPFFFFAGSGNWRARRQNGRLYGRFCTASSTKIHQDDRTSRQDDCYRCCDRRPSRYLRLQEGARGLCPFPLDFPSKKRVDSGRCLLPFQVYSFLPGNLLEAIAGFIFCFFGGLFPTLLAAIEGWLMCVCRLFLLT